MKIKLIEDYFEVIEEKENKKLKTFYILNNKEKCRSLIFQKGQKEAIQFMKSKFRSPFKRIIYFLITINFLQTFLKKVQFNSSVGQLIFFGGQTKIFDFEGKKVFSFLRGAGQQENFIKSKEKQIELSKKGLAPIIFKLNKEVPFCVEELLKESNNITDVDIFKKLFKYYETQEIKKIPYSSYIEKLERKNSFENLPEDLKKDLKDLKEKKKFFYVINVHGDFGKGQILLKNKEILFTDWRVREDLILADLFSFFKEDKSLFDNKKFLSILGMFPKDVKENVKDYLLIKKINNLYDVTNKKK